MLRFPVLTRSTARLLVCFYVLASCRALIPGLCATQAAILDAERDAGAAAVAATHACCSLVQPKQDASKHAPVRNSAPKCAFCELAKGYVTPSPVVTVDVATESHFLPPFLVSELRYASRVWDPCLARDPPDSNLT